ncbi:MAG: MATE family efflux transporter [Myxococcales bacterium]|nr:MATE family efflux transporter [Myxococcales bacterium]
MSSTTTQSRTAADGVLQVLLMAMPLVVSFVSFSLMSVVDSFIMGRVGTAEQGAVGLGALLAYGLAAIFTGTLTVINTFVAQDFGAGRRTAIARHVHAGLLLAPVFSGLVWCVLPWLPELIRLMGTSEPVAPLVRTYLSIRLLGVPCLFANFAITSFLRGLGDMRSPMIITLIANVLNAIFAVVLVFGLLGLPAMGIAGAALGSLLAAICEAGLYLGVFFGAAHHRQYATRRWHWPRAADLWRFLRVGLPIGFTMMFDLLSWTLFSIYAATLAPAALAAHVIVFQLLHFSFMPAAAVAIAGTTLVGQHLGAGEPDRAYRAAVSTARLGVGYMLLIGLLIGVFGRYLVGLFNPDPEVIAIGAVLFAIAGMFQPFDGLGMTLSGALRGAGDTRFPMLAMLASAAIVFLPGVYLLGVVFQWEIAGAWWAALVHIVTFGLLVAWRFRSGRWRTARV